MQLVWYRVGLASFILILIALFYKNLQRLKSIQHLMYFSVIGIVLALHWVAFFEAINVSSITVCLVGISTFPLFTSILEPFYFKEPFKSKNLHLSLLIVLGILIMSIGNTLPNHIFFGLFLGSLAAFLATIFTLMNRKMIQIYSGYTTGVYQLFIAFVFLTLINPHFLQTTFQVSSSDFFYLLILSILCTALAHIINIEVMRHLKAFVVSLVINLEPIYGIILASLIFSENDSLNLQFYLGSFVILAAIFIQPLLSKK
jgi:drug/metabolite transporter (DMT)-like permease